MGSQLRSSVSKCSEDALSLSLSLSAISCIALQLPITTTQYQTIFTNHRPRKMCCVFSGYWFKSIIRPRKVKKERSKKAKVHSANEKPNGSEESSHAHGEQISTPNGEAQGSRASPPISAQHMAATRIQTSFRCYRARKALHRQKGALRYNNILLESNDTQQQALSTLGYIHSWSNIQDQIRVRRHHMVTEGRIKQRKLEAQLKLEAKLQELEVEWCGSSDSMEEILCRIQQREEAAVKRERAMAYAFSHQWRANPTQYLGQAYYSIGKENWGWSWKERWIASRPWEIRVHAQPHYPKKVHIRQASQQEVKTPVTAKLALSNGKGSSKAKILPNPVAA